MTRRPSALGALVCATGVVALVSPAWPEASGPDLSARVSLSALTDEILPSQPLRLVVELGVEGDEPFYGSLHLSPGALSALLAVRGPGTERTLQVAQLSQVRGVDALPERARRTYQPGYALRTDVLALYDFSRGEYLFSSPGRYDLRLSVHAMEARQPGEYKEVWLKSNVLPVRVAEPGSGVRPRSLWTRPWQVEMLVGTGLSGIWTWLRAYPESPYAPYIAFALARESTLPVAERIGLLKQLVEGDPPAQIADLGLLQLAELLLGEKDYDGCRSYAEQVVALPTAPEHSKAKARDLIQRASRRLETQPPGAAPR